MVRTRNALGEEFVAAVYADWTKHGVAVLARVRSDSPGSYLRVVASLVPKDLIVQRAPNEFDKYSDAQLLEILQQEARSLLGDSEQD